jgi:predicted transcriptional regulator
MANQARSFRLDDSTRRKIEILAEENGNQSEVIRQAIDEFYVNSSIRLHKMLARANAIAQSIVDAHGCVALDALSACEIVAKALNFEFVAEEEDCRIYRTLDGQLINLWIEGVSCESVEDGGVGFDDQVTWYVNRQ